MKRIVYSRAALQTLLGLPSNTARLIRSKVEPYAADPASLGTNVTALKGEEGVCRFRGGDWRVLFTD